MRDLISSGLVFLILMGCAALGYVGLPRLPERHQSRETMQFTRLVAGLLVTFTALVLGLLIASTNAAFVKADADLHTYAADLIRLAADLDDIGPGTRDARVRLRAYTAAAIASTWPEETPPGGTYAPAAPDGSEFESTTLGDELDAVGHDIRTLRAVDDNAALLREAALKRLDAMQDMRWTLISEARGGISQPFYHVMLFWLGVVFVSFGMSAPRNALALASLVLVGLSVAGSIFVILELDGPLDGVVKVSSEPLRHALLHLDRSLATPEIPAP